MGSVRVTYHSDGSKTISKSGGGISGKEKNTTTRKKSSSSSSSSKRSYKPKAVNVANDMVYGSRVQYDSGVNTEGKKGYNLAGLGKADAGLIGRTTYDGVEVGGMQFKTLGEQQEYIAAQKAWQAANSDTQGLAFQGQSTVQPSGSSGGTVQDVWNANTVWGNQLPESVGLPQQDLSWLEQKNKAQYEAAAAKYAETGYVYGADRHWADAIKNGMDWQSYHAEEAKRNALRLDVAKKIGGTLLLGGVLGGIMKAARGSTAVARLAKIGTKGLPTGSTAATTAGKLATNPTTEKLTQSWLTSVLGKGYKFAAQNTTAIIGSYPFAGFIKEEALQTIGFAADKAIANGDFENAEAALALEDDMLNPSFTDKVVGAIPFVNVVDKLNDYFKAARIASSVRRKVLEDAKNEQAVIAAGGLPETEDDKWARIKQEQADSEKAMIDYYNEQKIKTEQMILEAREQANADAAKFWADYEKEKRKDEKEMMEAQAEFWLEYKKAVLELQAQANKPQTYTSTKSTYEEPSRLGFGLLR